MNADPAEAFTPSGYAALLDLARSLDFQFVTFSDAKAAAEARGRHCLMRHDIDVSLTCALRMADVEADRGIKATYFVMLRSGAYNLMSRAASGLLRHHGPRPR